MNLFNPTLVVLGGVFGRMAPFVADEVEDALDDRALRAPRDEVRVVPTSLGADATLIGAQKLRSSPSWLIRRPGSALGRGRFGW